jgi:hypothetical protein
MLGCAAAPARAAADQDEPAASRDPRSEGCNASDEPATESE